MINDNKITKTTQVGGRVFFRYKEIIKTTLNLEKTITFANLNIKLVHQKLSEMPKCILELKRQINDKTVLNILQIRKLVMNFNKEMEYMNLH